MLQWRRWRGGGRATGRFEEVLRLEQRCTRVCAGVQIWKHRCRCMCKAFALVVDCLNSWQGLGLILNEGAMGEVIATMQRGIEILESCNNVVRGFFIEEDFKELLYSLQFWVPLISFSTKDSRRVSASQYVAGSQYVADMDFLHRELEKATEQDREMIRLKSLNSRKVMRILHWEVRTDFQDDIPKFLLIPEKALTLIKPIGSGAYGAVYEAAWQGYSVAVKQFVKGAGSSFNRELAALMRLIHPNVVRMFGISYDQNSQQYSIVMEKMTMDLQSFIEQNGVSYVACVSTLLQVAKGMRYLHSCNVIHRDLKPGNVLVSYKDRSSSMLVKIADFGTSRINYYTCDATPNVGTKCFRAPEVAGDPGAGNIPYSKKADVYSFAMLCYYVLTRRMPFEDIMRRPYFLQVVCLEDKRPELPESCPEALASLIKRCWSRNVEQRPSFGEICDLLEELKACVVVKHLASEGLKNYQKLNALFLKSKRFSWQELATVRRGGERDSGDGKLITGERVSISCFGDEILFRVSGDEILFRVCGDIYASLPEHRNILKLYGICKDEKQNWVAVTDFYPERHSLRDSLDNGFVNWPNRLEIAVDCATGLEYLHSHGIIHRSISSYTIYLGDPLVAQILWDWTCTLDAPFSDDPIAGKLGYLDPEYFWGNSKVTRGCDVYSFGVVLLDLYTGMSQHSRLRLHDGSLHLDPYLMENRTSEMQLLKELALKCMQLPSSERPTMKEVVAELCVLRSMAITRQ